MEESSASAPGADDEGCCSAARKVQAGRGKSCCCRPGGKSRKVSNLSTRSYQVDTKHLNLVFDSLKSLDGNHLDCCVTSSAMLTGA
jgi:hypothetical protein